MLCVLVAIGPAGPSDYTVDIFGNANIDETIGEMDIAICPGNNQSIRARIPKKIEEV